MSSPAALASQAHRYDTHSNALNVIIIQCLVPFALHCPARFLVVLPSHSPKNSGELKVVFHVPSTTLMRIAWSHTYIRTVDPDETLRGGESHIRPLY